MTHINLRRDTAANWTAADPILQLGETGWETDTLKCKQGDGTSVWSDLDYAIIDASLYATLANPALTGNPTAPTQSSGDSSTKLATTAHVKSVTDPLALDILDKADLDSPNFTGTPTAPTPTVGDDSLKIATTEFIKDAIDTALLAVTAIPTGTVDVWSGGAAPAGWMLCQGGTVLRSSALGLLYGAMSPAYPYGTGDGSTTCNVPNLIGRVPVGVDTGSTEFNVIGETGGEKTHILDIAEMPAHLHGTAVRWATDAAATGAAGRVTQVGGVGPSSGTTGDTGATTATGSNGAHNNLQPYMAMHYKVKL